jgi:hypothetical protein
MPVCRQNASKESPSQLSRQRQAHPGPSPVILGSETPVSIGLGTFRLLRTPPIRTVRTHTLRHTVPATA